MLFSSKAASGRPGGVPDLYRAVWRWHFYAGLLVLPFLILLAVTGALYAFHGELDALIHHDKLRVAVQDAPRQLPQQLVAAALRAEPGTAFRYTPPSRPDASAEIAIRNATGERRVVYADPYSGRVLGAIAEKGTAMGIVRRIHSLAFFGPVANGVIEIAAGWSILLVGTGLYLWWPRPAREKGGVVTLRGTPRRRIFWRDLHAVTGAFVGLALVFLAATGMPWSGVWGSAVNQWANGHDFGYPAGLRVALPMSDEHLGHSAPTSWSLEQARLPRSTHPAAEPIGLDAAVAEFDRLGLAPGYAVSLPAGGSGVYSGSVYPSDLAQQRVVHLDQYSGQPLLDMGYADYGPAGRALEWGINVHLGQEWGLANQLGLVIVCLGIVVLCVSGAVMWWKRRPRGALGVPPLPRERRVLRGVVAILVLGGIVFPLVGLSLIVMLAADRMLVRLGDRARMREPA
ncbi:PepSY-associated TM helix domain-containing protein [Teichococcus vastitatis]|uniref:PepSY domain-containing protein n=1 Tax=Teichococcus vastitatis TaxID=2307076 RepID=A0ABS9W504_9PROT|nr:PepSY domain-containing protein [Pseudoroseomonas vastitatis]MCI0754118.1 PepSY domain-containing protein [Pseudoroseomonas vastitatis]